MSVLLFGTILAKVPIVAPKGEVKKKIKKRRNILWERLLALTWEQRTVVLP